MVIQCLLVFGYLNCSGDCLLSYLPCLILRSCSPPAACKVPKSGDRALIPAPLVV